MPYLGLTDQISSSRIIPFEISSTDMASKVRMAILRRCDIFLASAGGSPLGIAGKYFCHNTVHAIKSLERVL
jgi:hypothetical protein